MDELVKSYKVPIPKSLIQIFSEDSMTRMLYTDLLLHACHKDQELRQWWHGNRRVSVVLKKGECHVSISRLVREMYTTRERIEYSLNILKGLKFIDFLKPKGGSKGLLIKVIDYAAITVFPDQHQTNTRPIPHRHQTDTRLTPEQYHTNSQSNKDNLDTLDNLDNLDNIYIHEFENFWQTYPKKDGKLASLQAFKLIREKYSLETIMNGLRQHKVQWIDRKVQVQYIPKPSVFLAEAKFLDLEENGK